MARRDTELLQDLLRDVSRSFYLTLRVLPARVRPQIGLAYLLARTTDTVADTELIPVDRRLAALQTLRQSIAGKTREAPEFKEFTPHQGSAAERLLLEKFGLSLELLHSFEAPDARLIREVLETITCGQELDLARFGQANATRVVALANDQELDDYTFRVAGCVGEFWTKMCRAHLFPDAPLDDTELLTNGVRLGKGLQLVNILRDLPRDLRQGRCYLPAPALRAVDLQPPDLLDPGNETRFRPAYEPYLSLAESHLHAGWIYTNLLPRNQVRVRLACVWPLLIGLDTLELLRRRDVLDPTRRVKVSRRRVRQLMLRSSLACAFPPAWNRLVAPTPASSVMKNPASAGYIF